MTTQAVTVRRGFNNQHVEEARSNVHGLDSSSVLPVALVACSTFGSQLSPQFVSEGITMELEV